MAGDEDTREAALPGGAPLQVWRGRPPAPGSVRLV